MKKLVATLLFIACCMAAQGQSLHIDIQRDWYAYVPTIDISMQDTLELYPFIGNFDQSRQVYVWHYMGKDVFELYMYNNQQNFSRPYTFAPEKWKFRENSDGTFTVTVKDRRNPQPVHRTYGTYKLIPYRDDHNILYKILLVKNYNNRYTQHMKIPAAP